MEKPVDRMFSLWTRGTRLASGPASGVDNVPRTCGATRGERVMVVSSGFANVSARCLRPRW
eukprot:3779767-Lingulodinium_polyedra.AAC.1